MGHENFVTFKVRYCETDRMGIVHHSRYFPWFEVGRGEFIEDSGYSYAHIESMGLMIPLIESGAKYFEGARHGDSVTIKTTIINLGAVRCKFGYEVNRVLDGKLLTTGFTEHAFVDNFFRPINAKKKFPEIWGLLCNLL